MQMKERPFRWSLFLILVILPGVVKVVGVMPDAGPGQAVQVADESVEPDWQVYSGVWEVPSVWAVARHVEPA